MLPPYVVSRSTCEHNVVQYKNEFYAPAFYIHRPLPVIKSMEALTECAKTSAQKDRYIFVTEKDLAEFKDTSYSILLISSEKLANREQKLILIKFVGMGNLI